MERHLNDFWNVVDLLSYFLIIAAVFVRYFYQDESHTIARNLFALSLLVMYLRFLQVFLVHKKMGPTLMMIKEMVWYFFYFEGTFHKNKYLNISIAIMFLYLFSGKGSIHSYKNTYIKNYNKAFQLLKNILLFFS